MTLLDELYSNEGQSPWLDNLRRDWIHNGHLQKLLGDGVRGITSNPTIFAKAISGEDDYDEQFKSLLLDHTVEEAYWELVTTDINDALAMLNPIYLKSKGTDGFVSLEVSPELAHDTASTLEAARKLNAEINKPNLLVKIPATLEGIPAIKAMISEGRNVNVTLIFGIDRYDMVVEAYISGLEAFAKAHPDSDLNHISSVASFFVSRVDTEIDRRIDLLTTQVDSARSSELLELRGKAATTQAKLAYQHFKDAFSGPRWDALAQRGGQVQRPLWASTSTKNPNYPDLLYVDSLIGPDTVNTMPEETLLAFNDHGTLMRTIDSDIDLAKSHLEVLDSIGIDLEDVESTLEKEGVASFSKSFSDLLDSLTEKAKTFH